MTSTDAAGRSATADPARGAMDMRLEVVVLPVSDVDRAKRFYEGLGWRLDADLATSEDFRVVQLTPPGSTVSVIFGTGLTTATPGSVDSLIHHAGTTARVPGPDPEGRSYGSWAAFDDPDGNGWLLQQITERLPGR